MTDIDFNPNPSACATMGHSYEYVCADGSTYAVFQEWKAIISSLEGGGNTSIWAPVTSITNVLESIQGPKGATGLNAGLKYGKTADTTTPNTGYYSFSGLTFYIAKTSLESHDASDYWENAVGSSGVVVIQNINNPTPISFIRYEDCVQTGPDTVSFSIGSTFAYNPENYSQGTENFIYYLSSGPKGETGEQGTGGTSGLSFGNMVNRSFLEVENPTTLKVRSLDRNIMRINDDNSVTLSKYIENSSNTNHTSGGSITIPASVTPNYVINMQSNLTGINLGATWGVGKPVNIVLKQPTSGNTVYTFNSAFSYVEDATFSYATGLTYPIGSNTGDIDVFYVYCYDGAGEERSFLINHQRYHDTE